MRYGVEMRFILKLRTCTFRCAMYGTSSLLRSAFQDRVILFGKDLGDQGKCRSPKMLKLLIEVPYVGHLKEQVLSFNSNLFSAP